MVELMYGGGDKPDLGLDLVAESSFLSWFHKMPPKEDDVIRLFDRGDFFSVHGPDAIVVAATVYKTQSVVKMLGKGKDALPSCTLNMTAGKNFLREALTVKQLKIEIWGGGSSKKHSWKLEKQATPGNLQEVEDLLYSGADLETSPIVLALKIKVQDGVKTVGAAFADATHRVLGVSEFAENDLFSNTESLIIQLGARECLLPADEKNSDYDLVKLKEVIDRCDCVISSVKKSDFNPKSIEQDLNRLLNEASAGDNLAEFNLQVAMGAMQALLHYLDLLSNNVNFGAFTFQTHDLSQYLRLDRSALRALSVFPEPGQGGVNKSASLFGLLNKCKTAQGQRLLAQWLKQPLIDAKEIRKRHQLVAILAEDATLRQTLQTDFLRYMPDLLRNSKRFQKGIASLEDVVNVYQGIIRLPGIISNLEEVETGDQQVQQLIQNTFINPLKESQHLLAKLVEMVETTIDLDELERHHYVIKAEYDDRLTRIKESINTALEQLDKEHNRVKKDLNMPDKVKLEDTQQYGFCFRVTRNDSKVLVSKRNQYTELGTSKAGVYFTTKAAKELCDDHIDLQNQYSAHQSGLVKQVIAVAAGYCPPLESLNVIIATLDVLVCYAHVSINAPIPYVQPEITELGKNGSLDIKEVRHPCLEVQEDLNFIPNDVEMIHKESEFLIITGPNMGGKSTYIRSIGIVALMSQAGCFVPTAADANVPVFDSILARVGAGDSQLKGVSTFMSEMLETSTILRLATEDSLIIIDELGRGTSTYDGFGLAWSISEYIATRLRSKCLFASHFAEIVELANQIQHVQNLHCKALVEQRKGSTSKQDREITLLYKVEKGTSDRSYGIHVAELAGFPQKVIQLAKRKAEEMEDLDGEEAPLLSMDVETTEKGMAIVEEILRAFASETKRRRIDSDNHQEEVAILADLVSKYKGRALSDPWIQKALECL